MTIDELWDMWPSWAINAIVVAKSTLANQTQVKREELHAMAARLTCDTSPTFTGFAGEEAMRQWVENTPRLLILKLYQYLNAQGYRMAGIEAAIRQAEAQAKSAKSAVN